MKTIDQATAPAALRELTTVEFLAVSGGGGNYHFPGNGSRSPSATYGVPLPPPIPVAPAPTMPPMDLNYQF